MADDTRPKADEEEVNFLELLLTAADSDITVYDVNNPQDVEDLANVVALNQASFQEIEANRRLLATDAQTGEELYEIVEPESIPIGRTWQYDFVAENFVMGENNSSPKKIEDNDFGIISQWIHRAITTERYVYSAYPNWYGVEMAAVFQGDLTGIVALNHIRNTMREAIIMHDRITQVDNIEVAEDSGTIWFSCDVYLDNSEGANPISVAFQDGELING